LTAFNVDFHIIFPRNPLKNDTGRKNASEQIDMHMFYPCLSFVLFLQKQKIKRKHKAYESSAVINGKEKCVSLTLP
jgi:hypothetical protein